MGAGKGKTKRASTTSFNSPQWVELSEEEWVDSDQHFRVAYEKSSGTWNVFQQGRNIINCDTLTEARKHVASIYQRMPRKTPRLMKIRESFWKTTDGRFEVRRGGDHLYVIDDRGIEEAIVDEYEKVVKFIAKRYSRENKGQKKTEQGLISIDLDELVF